MPAGLAVLGAIWLFLGLKDDPKSVGLPDLPDTKTVKDTEGANKVSQAAFLKHMVWKNRWVWTLAIANVFVYVLRMGVLDWGPKFLTEDRGMNIKSAAWVVAIFEITAIVGTIVAGWATDKIFKGKAHRMCLICMIGAVLFLGAFALLPNVHIAISTTFLAMGGFFIYGPQALIGIASANQATKEASATANGLAGVLGYLGSALSAIGVGIIADNFGWDWVFISFIAVGLIGALIFLSMWQAPRDGYKRSLEIKE
jgi:OPA family glycerol-3-phosphate transporter-like MFS transporter/OPA family sugar phosphate sensor protein UhpC-like MFS transporter